MIRPHLTTEGRYPSAGTLGKAVSAHARSEGLAEGRVRAWVAYMMLAGRFAAAAAEKRGAGMTVKGGVALELRLHPTARATDDIDIIVQQPNGDILNALDTSLTTENEVAAEHEGFTFQRKGQAITLESGAIRLALSVRYEGGAWTTISIDLAPEELPGIPPEYIQAIDLSDFHLKGPGMIPCLPLNHQIAQKIHGMTQPPREGSRNERVKDAADLLLLEERVTDYRELRQACKQVFEFRRTHEWPPKTGSHDHWREEYDRLAKEYGLRHATFEGGIAAITRFIARIEEAS